MHDLPSIARSRIGVAIVQWNNAAHTIQLLTTLMHSTAISSIVVCDNNSAEGEFQKLFSEAAKLSNTRCNITLIRNKHNSGFARGISVSIEALLDQSVDWIWLLNNDVTIAEDELRTIAREIGSAKPNIYSTPMIENDGEPFFGCFSFNRWTSRFTPIKSNHDAEEIEQKYRYVSGANMLVHKNVFQATGLFNQQTFLYFEELDFVRRALKNGFKQKCLSKGLVRHIGAGSFNNGDFDKMRLYHETWSTLFFYKNHEPMLYAYCLVFRTFTRILTLGISGRSKLVPSVVIATSDFLKGHNRDSKSPSITSKHLL